VLIQVNNAANVGIEPKMAPKSINNSFYTQVLVRQRFESKTSTLGTGEPQLSTLNYQLSTNEMSIDRILNVPYNLPGTQSWQWINLYTRMSQERILFIDRPITDGFANSAIAALLYLESVDNTKPIYVYINSLGDPVMAGMAGAELGMMSVMAGLAIYDTMRHIKSDVYTICLGQAMGISTLLLSAGTKSKRACLPHAEIGLMPARAGSRGQASDIVINAGEVLAKRTSVAEVLAETTGQSVERILADSERMFYMTAEEAVAYGVIDKVLESAKEGTKLATASL
jgi:ATP-dependent Clp protease, protease subunit